MRLRCDLSAIAHPLPINEAPTDEAMWGDPFSGSAQVEGEIERC